MQDQLLYKTLNCQADTHTTRPPAVPTTLKWPQYSTCKTTPASALPDSNTAAGWGTQCTQQQVSALPVHIVSVGRVVMPALQTRSQPVPLSCKHHNATWQPSASPGAAPRPVPPSHSLDHFVPNMRDRCLCQGPTNTHFYPLPVPQVFCYVSQHVLCNPSHVPKLGETCICPNDTCRGVYRMHTAVYTCRHTVRQHTCTAITTTATREQGV